MQEAANGLERPSGERPTGERPAFERPSDAWPTDEDARTPRVSVVIRCCNEERHIGRLLAGLMEQSLRDHLEVIVVDSGSTDATLAIASRFPVRVLSIPPEEFSFGRSLNVGCRAARGELIAIASAHVYPTFRDWLERLIEPFEAPDVALCYGKQRGNEVTRYSEHQVFRRWFPERSERRQRHPFCNNANAAIRRALWEEFPYDEELTGLEDLDWARRVSAAGHAIAYVAEAEVVHVHEETPRRIYNRYRREAIALKRIFPQERFGVRDLLRLLPSNVASDWFHAWRDGVLSQTALDIVLFRSMQFLGTQRGFATGALTSELKRTFYYPRVRREECQSRSSADLRIDYAKHLEASPHERTAH